MSDRRFSYFQRMSNMKEEQDNDDMGSMMTKPDGTTPPNGGTKRTRSDDEEPTRRVAPRTGDDAVSKEAINVKDLRKELYSDDEEKLARTLDVLCDQVNEYPKKQELCFVVVDVMKWHDKHQDIQVHGIRVLTNATYADKEEDSCLSAEVEGLKTILTAMKAFPDVFDVVLHGFEAFRNLCYYEHHANSLVTSSGDMKFLIGRMKHFSKDSNLMESACSLLENLSYFVQLRKALIDAGSLSSLGIAIESHKDDESNAVKQLIDA